MTRTVTEFEIIGKALERVGDKKIEIKEWKNLGTKTIYIYFPNGTSYELEFDKDGKLIETFYNW